MHVGVENSSSFHSLTEKINRLCVCVCKKISLTWTQTSFSVLSSAFKTIFTLKLPIYIGYEASAPAVYSFTFIILNLVTCLGAKDDRSGHLVKQKAAIVLKMSVWFYVGSMLFVCLITIHIHGKEIQKNMTFQLPHVICVQTIKY